MHPETKKQSRHATGSVDVKSQTKKQKLKHIPEKSNQDAMTVTNNTNDPTGWELLEEPKKNTQIANTAATQPPHTKLTKHEKKRQKTEKEQAIRTAEKRRLSGGSIPTTVEDFEAAVLASPSSSYVWIQYMAFLIGQGELDRALSLVDRALTTINYREDNEKFNIWVAALNTEVMYGSDDSSLALLNKALTRTDPKKLYLAAVDIFERAGKHDHVENCLKAVCRKHGGSMDVWLRVVRYRLEEKSSSDGDDNHDDDDIVVSEKGERVKAVLDRALKSLPTSDHIKMITQTALLEFKKGDPERGRGLFENILRNYPKRLDLWSVYLDQEIAQGARISSSSADPSNKSKSKDNESRARSLFERCTHLTLPPKKMKFLFKRWMEWEKKVGGDVEHVKQRAMEFVQSVGG